MKSLHIVIIEIATMCGAAYPLQAAQADAVIAGQVLDAETRSVISATVAIRTSRGVAITDHPGFREGFRCEGRFEKNVPAGDAIITVSRGFDYGAVTRKLRLAAGERADLTFELRRRTPLRREGWYCGDNHAHMIHDNPAFPVTFEYTALAARAEALDYLSLAHHWNLADPTPSRLDREFERVSTRDCLLAWNMEMPKNYWRGDVAQCVGHGWTVAMRGYTADGKDAIRELHAMSAWDYESDKTPTPNFESQALIHALGGGAFYSHPVFFHWGKWGGKGIYPVEERKFLSNLAAELPFDTVVGPTYDGFDILQGVPSELAQQLWFLLLNHGYRIPATASSDATFADRGRAVPGKARVYTRLTGPFTLPAIAEAMKAGRNFVTTGPLLVLEIDGRQIGDVIRVRGPERMTARVRAWASGAAGEHLTAVQIIRNGKIVKLFEIGRGATEFAGGLEITEQEPAWYIARCYGSGVEQAAFTNPIYFETDRSAPPAPTLAHVTGAVKDSHTGEPLDGTAEVVTMVGRKPVREFVRSFKNGQFTLEVPGTSRILVKASGYRPVMKSVYMDFAPLLETTLKMTPEQMLDWRTFERFRSLLRDVRLDFNLASEAGH